ncbi:hypothetical protein [Nocardia sp. XZ_19_369]|uniref:hypothetical protein n=1 Tax=Nocardia sp. XZ_19_369 TaxID=2769487 RepID=UPI00188E7D52|nr:hypothetical protein [Nocardia sp. XZ_19_369]
MTRHRPSLGNADSGRPSRTPIGHHPGDGASVSAAVLCAVAAGPVAGGQLVLLGKPFGGVLGVPGAVVGYLALTAGALGLLAGALCLWRLRLSLGMVSASGCLAGIAVVVAGVVDTVAVFTIAVLVAGAATGPLLLAGRALAAEFGRGNFVLLHAAAAGGVAVAAWLSGHYYEEPGTGLLIAGALTTALGVAVGLVGLRGADGPSADRVVENSIPPRPALFGYVAIGLAAGGTVLPALHLLLFRWNEFGAEQLIWLAVAAAPAAAIVALPGRRPAAVPVLLILAAGGALLVVTAPGLVPLTIGLAVTLAAAARAMTALDELVWETAPHAISVCALVVATAGLAGLGLVDLLGRLIGTGSALTILGMGVLIAAWLSGRPDRRLLPGTRGSSSERGAP